MRPISALGNGKENLKSLRPNRSPPHVGQQAIEVAKRALHRLASDSASAERIGSKIQRIYTLARSQVGHRLLNEHQIEPFDAIDVKALRDMAPAQAKQLDAVEGSKAERAKAVRRLP
ncbi:hypothetical protein ACS5PN_17125 [Roseateles sp. NT4]|uniref:hypothetical protein n=1 Tax=Roseateles sp. NT4 TaxID=3453715 RepID=UPI003EEDA4F8